LLRPGSLSEFLEMWQMWPDAKIVAGGTLAIPERRRQRTPPPALCVAGIAELHEAGPSLRGAGTTLAAMACDTAVPEALRMAASSVGSLAVRNAATLGGNIAASAPGCAAVALLALDCHVRVLRPDGSLERVPVSETVGRGGGLIVTVEWNSVRRARFMKARLGSMGTIMAVVAISAAPCQHDWRVALGGKAIIPHRSTSIEAQLNCGQLQAARAPIRRAASDNREIGSRAAVFEAMVERLVSTLYREHYP
jgi:CO/xanthine dehydrogenase FAD-binding subunit